MKLIACLLFGISAYAQPLVTVSGTVVEATGQNSVGSVTVSWPTFIYNGQPIIAASKELRPSGGTLSTTLHPGNYTVVYRFQNGNTTQMRWIVPVGSPWTRTIAEVQTTFVATPTNYPIPIALGGTGEDAFTASQCIRMNSAGTAFESVACGSGTVTSVALALPNIFSVSGSPVTSSGTITATLASQSANLVLASPNGSSGTPTFRKVKAADTDDTTGTGAFVLANSPTLGAPAIADFTNAIHGHTGTSSGGTLATSAIGAGTFPGARGGLGADASAFTGVLKMSSGVASVVTGTGSDCVKVDGTSGTCGSGGGSNNCVLSDTGSTATLATPCKQGQGYIAEVSLASSLVFTPSSGTGTASFVFRNGAYYVYHDVTGSCSASGTCVGGGATPPSDSILLGTATITSGVTASVNAQSGQRTTGVINGTVITWQQDAAGRMEPVISATAYTPYLDTRVAAYCADAGSNDTYACSPSPSISSIGYTTGAMYVFKANTANTGAATINLVSLGAKTIKKQAGGITTDLDDNDIRAGQWVVLIYDGTNMQMVSALGNAASGGSGGTSAQSFTSSGTYTPATGVTRVRVRVLAGGGGGARGGFNQPGEGGGGGGFREGICTVTPGVGVTVTVGAGGGAGNATNGNSGLAGGNSSFGTCVVANGGKGGDHSAGRPGLGGTNDISPLFRYIPLGASTNDTADKSVQTGSTYHIGAFGTAGACTDHGKSFFSLDMWHGGMGARTRSTDGDGCAGGDGLTGGGGGGGGGRASGSAGGAAGVSLGGFAGPGGAGGGYAANGTSASVNTGGGGGGGGDNSSFTDGGAGGSGLVEVIVL